MSEQIKPGSIFVDEFMLFTDKGEEFDLKTFIVSISIFEDLFSNVLSGMAIITDNLNLVGTIPIVGREIINVRARVPGFQNCQINRAFFIYSVQNRAATSQDRQQTYEIHFISLEGMVDNITFVSKKYNGPTDEIAEKIFNEYLRLPRIWSKEYPFPIGLSKNNNLLNPEWYPQVPQTNLNQLSIGGGRPFKSKVCWVVPMWTPFKAINWLANRSIDGSTEGPNVLCWESSQGFYFASMDTIFENQKDVKNRKNFYYGLDDAGIEVIQKSQGGTNALAKGYEKVEDVVIPMVSDVLKSQDYGHMASNMHVLDIAVKDYKEYIFDYASNFDTFNHLDGDKPAFNVNQIRNIYSYRTFRTAHKKLFNDYEEPNYDKWVLQRNSLMFDLSNLRIEITVPGFFNTEAGEVVNFYYPRMTEKGGGMEIKDLIDPYLSGSYVVVAARHIIGEDKYRMKLELVKESLSTSLV